MDNGRIIEIDGKKIDISKLSDKELLKLRNNGFSNLRDEDLVELANEVFSRLNKSKKDLHDSIEY